MKVIDSRDEQCRELTGQAKFRDEAVVWSAGYIKDHQACRLVCSTEVEEKTRRKDPKRKSPVMVANLDLGRQVRDGTRCSYDDLHTFCSAGNCMAFGCDYSTDTSKKFDKCGVCEGDGSKCGRESQEYIGIEEKLESMDKNSAFGSFGTIP